MSDYFFQAECKGCVPTQRCLCKGEKGESGSPGLPGRDHKILISSFCFQGFTRYIEFAHYLILGKCLGHIRNK